MPEPLPLLTEASWRCALLLALVWTSLRLLEAPAAVAHRAWTAACATMLALPLLLALPAIVVALPDPPAPAAFAVRAPGAAAEAPPHPWEQVEYRRRPPSWRGAAAATYGGGLALFAALLAAAVVRVELRRHRSIRPPAELARRLAAEGLDPAAFRVSETLKTPAAAGWWRPVILLPAASRHWDRVTLHAVAAHELAHRRRRDALWLLLAHLNRCVFWFHPAAWWLVRRLRQLSETVADEAGAAAVGRRAYARCLVALASDGELELAAPMALRSSVPQRLRRLARAPRQHSPGTPRTLICGVLLLFAAGGALPLEIVRPAPPAFHREVARLRSSDPEARAEALYRLGRWPRQSARALPLLVAHLGDEAPIREMPRWDFHAEGWAPARRAWRRPSPGEVAALGLASMSRRAAPALEDALLRADPVVRRNAAWALGELRHPRGLSASGVRRLIAALRDPDPEVRGAAAWALGDLGEQAALPELRALLRRESAPRALAESLAALQALESGRTLEDLRLQASLP